MILLKKLNVRSAPTSWRLDWIKEVCDGNQEPSDSKFHKMLITEHIMACRELYGNFNVKNYINGII